MDSAYIKFNGGIWSEQLKGRYDLGNYKSASRTCENFIPTRYGQVEKRSGTKYLGNAKNPDKVCVLHPFQYSVNTKFILEFGEKYIRFWSNDSLVPHRDPVPWVSGTKYLSGDVVEDSGIVYQVVKSNAYLAPITNTNVYLPSPDGILEAFTPYLESELYELQMRAINDVVYIVHPNHPVGKLTRIADNHWRYAEADIEFPFVDPDVSPLDVTITASDTTGADITLTASESIFTPDYVGSVIRLQHTDEGNVFSLGSTGLPASKPLFSPTTTYYKNDVVHKTVNSNRRFLFEASTTYDPSAAWASGTYAVNDLVNFSGAVYICTDPHTSADDPTVNTADWNRVLDPDDATFYFDVGMTRVNAQISDSWSFRTRGIWNGIWEIRRSLDGGNNYVTIKSLSSNEDQNYLVEETESGADTKVKIVMVAITADTTKNMGADFTVVAGSRFGEARINSVAPDGLTATAGVTKPIYLAGEPSVLWSESAFSPRQGYPRSIALLDSRLILAGTSKKPQAFFYSGLGAYEDFKATTTQADAPFFVEALSEDQSSIQWISSQRELFVGTASVEGILLTRKQDEAQSAENLPIVRWNESMGSAHRSALPMRDSLMCLQRGRTTINLLAYSLESDGYIGEEVSLLCSHLFASGVQQMSHLREPYTGAYTIQEDGTMCHVVYEPKLQVTGWCKFTTQDGFFESVAVIPSATSDEDEVWCVVRRIVNGVTQRCVERFTINNRRLQEAEDTDNLWYLDAAVKKTGTDITIVSGLDHLEGRTVCVLADGVKGEYIVNTGSITLNAPADTVIAGLPVVSKFEPLDLEGESSAGKRKQLYQSKLMMHKSLGGAIAFDSQDYKDIVYHTSGDLMDSSIPLKSGFAEVFHESSHARQKYWRIKHDEPHPFTLQAVIQSFTIGKH